MNYKKVLTGTVGAVALTWIGLQTPFFAKWSEILVFKHPGKRDCLKIKKQQSNDLTVRRGFLSGTFYAYEAAANGQTFEGSILPKEVVSYDERLKGRNLKAAREQGCEVVTFNGDLMRVPHDQKGCFASIGHADAFYSIDHTDGYIRCTFDKLEGGYNGNCRYEGYFDEVKVSISIPSNQLENWRVALAAARDRFDRTFEVLDFCPIRIPLI